MIASVPESSTARPRSLVDAEAELYLLSEAGLISNKRAPIATATLKRAAILGRVIEGISARDDERRELARRRGQRRTPANAAIATKDVTG
ncbi:MAG TPA: hypothetical protein VL117_07380 [Thermoleophilia bacterium]|nr:hypothetical protein [Thermoleophilia bacterium]